VGRERHNELAVLSTSAVVRALVEDWGLSDPLVSPHGGGMYVGGPQRAVPFVSAYLAEAPIGRSELERSMHAMLWLRWAVQADYFARRIATDDLTGIDGRADNEAGLEDARRSLTRRVRGA
jgi:hypothetical protein